MSPVLKKAFDGFDHEKKGAINCDVVATILRMMGQAYNAQTLKELIEEVDADGRSRLFIYPRKCTVKSPSDSEMSDQEPCGTV